MAKYEWPDYALLGFGVGLVWYGLESYFQFSGGIFGYIYAYLRADDTILNRYQTLITGGIALIVGFLAYRSVFVTLEARKTELQHERRVRGFKAVVAVTMDITLFFRNAINCLDTIKSLPGMTRDLMKICVALETQKPSGILSDHYLLADLTNYEVLIVTKMKDSIRATLRNLDYIARTDLRVDQAFIEKAYATAIDDREVFNTLRADLLTNHENNPAYIF